jgi:histidine kinase 2/3/4 (cytokinin receptor)
MTFAKYAERTELPLTSGLLYAVRITHAEREEFERQQGWSIKSMYMNSSKKFSPGSGEAENMEISEEYAPVIFAQEAYKNVISFDMLSASVSGYSRAAQRSPVTAWFHSSGYC